jgi:hypothetical protein
MVTDVILPGETGRFIIVTWLLQGNCCRAGGVAQRPSAQASLGALSETWKKLVNNAIRQKGPGPATMQGTRAGFQAKGE